MHDSMTHDVCMVVSLEIKDFTLVAHLDMIDAGLRMHSHIKIHDLVKITRIMHEESILLTNAHIDQLYNLIEMIDTYIQRESSVILRPLE